MCSGGLGAIRTGLSETARLILHIQLVPGLVGNRLPQLNNHGYSGACKKTRKGIPKAWLFPLSLFPSHPSCLSKHPYTMCRPSLTSSTLRPFPAQLERTTEVQKNFKDTPESPQPLTQQCLGSARDQF